MLAMQRLVSATVGIAAFAAVTFQSGCGPQPYQVVQAPPPARTGTVESVNEIVEQKSPSGAGLIVGGLVGGGLGSLIGSGTGRTVATVVGAAGGAYAGNQVEKNKAGSQVVYQIGVRLDDGSWVTTRQAAPTGLKIGDRVRMTDSGIEMLR